MTLLHICVVGGLIIGFFESFWKGFVDSFVVEDWILEFLEIFCGLFCCHNFVDMSGGTPVGGGFVRQRHSQGYTSSDNDLEDDASSRVHHHQSPEEEKTWTWVGVVENCLWIASAVFIVYYGDQHSNFIYLLWHDDRIRR